PFLPYGGVGESGMGRYHGKESFETFSNSKSILKKTNLFDIPVRYPPYTDGKLKILKKFMH
ncbi:MAG: aldehyde dehydrogenase, partial [Bacteroidales bacterium]|nr:aldehyde dehydrogenase [Bacteroidales bacterium]